ncbi:MAG: branched-chain amino acid transport system ATP-binding protein [Solirubrobacteraceae bacterium]
MKSSQQPHSGQAALQTSGLIAGYLPDVDIVKHVDVEVHAGEIVTIVGPNGAGKSTLIKAIFGLVAPRQGKILLWGERIDGCRPHAIARRQVGYVPQTDDVFGSLTVQENLEMGLLAGPGADRRERLEAMYELFPRLRARSRQAAGTMSGGERRMVAMARALMSTPRVLLLDEPSAGLSPLFVDVLFEKIAEVNRSGVTVLMVEQNARRALAMSDRGYVLELGRNRFEGPGAQLIDDPRVAELYLGGSVRSARLETTR